VAAKALAGVVLIAAIALMMITGDSAPLISGITGLEVL
jgi:hypothetical protein